VPPLPPMRHASPHPHRLTRPGLPRKPAQDPSEGQTVTSALASALDSGQLDSATFNAAVQRVTALRGVVR